jgi:hypothetical protein
MLYVFGPNFIPTMAKTRFSKPTHALLWLVWVGPSSLALIPCQCFMETCTGDLGKAYTKNLIKKRKRDRT